MKAIVALLSGFALLVLVTGCGEAPAGGPTPAPAAMAAPADPMAGQCKTICAKIIGAMNMKDTAKLDSLIDAKFKDNNPMPGYKADKAGVMKMFADLFVGFPDSNCTVDLILSEGDTVAMKLTTTGTNTGEFMGMPATNKSIKVDEIHILKIKGGKVIEHWGLADDMTMMTQLGLMKPPEAAK